MRFFSVSELNKAIEPLLDQLNAQPFQKLDGSRNQWFDSLDKPKLQALPQMPYVLAYWSEATVNIDYHVVVDHHYYSVPYSLVHHCLQVRLTETTVELFEHGQRIAAHARSFQRGKFTTLEEHRPKSHQRYLEWTPAVSSIGPAKSVPNVRTRRNTHSVSSMARQGLYHQAPQRIQIKTSLTAALCRRSGASAERAAKALAGSVAGRFCPETRPHFGHIGDEHHHALHICPPGNGAGRQL